MRRRIVKIQFLFLFIGFSVLFSAEKVGTTSFQFLKVGLDGRSSAMGGAAVSVINTSDAVFWNPAALRMISGKDISASYTDYFLDINLISGAAAFPLGASSSIGIFVMYLNYGSLEVSTYASQSYGRIFNPYGLTGEVINPWAGVIGGSYAFSVTDKLSFGITAKYFMEDLIKAKASSFAFDGGLIYETGWRTLKFGLAIRNFGPEVTFLNEPYPVPETFDAGISGYFIAPHNALLGSLGSQTLLFSFNLTHPRDYDQQYNFGAEYGFMDILFFRGGYKLNYDAEGLTCGAGLRYNNFRLDYAYDKFGEILPSVHRFSLGYALN